ncbi:MAG: hypothetical protein K2Y22_13625 [Candidatus Obscuribacterales bacterium]|nr:hypothetical protein [Candidatus Obscuribacterales bacterium]
MRRVLVVNNYPLAGVWQEVKDGQTPDQYLYGINYFSERNYQAELIDFAEDPFLSSLQKTYNRLRLPLPIGDLEQQARILADKNADLIYAPCQTQTYLLSYMRALGLFKTPLVVVAHQPLNMGMLAATREPFVRLMVNGCDAFPAMSKAVSGSINKRVANLKEPKSKALTWGPDKDYYPENISNGETIVAAGRTGRDFLTFAKACAKMNQPAHILCLQESFSPGIKVADCVEVTVRPDDSFLPFPDLVKIYAKARALAIPLYSADHLNGLSSLVDALAMAKPVIMTKNPYIDIDIEALGIGFWVEPNDEEGWTRAIRFFQDNPDKAIEMGKTGRSLVDSGWNSKTFASQIMDIFDWVLNE